MDETDTRRFIQNELSMDDYYYLEVRTHMQEILYQHKLSTKVPLLSNEIL